MFGNAFVHQPVMDVCWLHHGKSAVVVFVVVPIKEIDAESSGVLDFSKPVGKVRTVLQRLELRLAVRIIVRHVRS